MLLVINGAPGIGKSTLARRYVDGLPLALLVELDQIRMQLGGWADRDESRIVARSLALELMRAHLSTGRDVVVPQFLGRPQYLADMRNVAETVGTAYVEVCLTCAPETLIERFQTRRSRHVQLGLDHPESDLDDESVVAELTRTNETLVRDARLRHAIVVSIDGDLDTALASLRHALGTVGK